MRLLLTPCQQTFVYCITNSSVTIGHILNGSYGREPGSFLGLHCLTRHRRSSLCLKVHFPVGLIRLIPVFASFRLLNSGVYQMIGFAVYIWLPMC